MSQSPTPSALRVVLFGALVAGTLDLAYAFTAYGLKGIAPLGILQSIAAGWLGKASRARCWGWSRTTASLASPPRSISRPRGGSRCW